MPRKLTKEIKYVRLNEKRIGEIEDLVASWPYETMAFMRARLNQYNPPSDFINALLDMLLSLFVTAPKRKFKVLKDPDILTDWQKRFEISGQTNPQEAWHKILEKELSAKDYVYLLSLLDRELTDIHIPWELKTLFEKIYRAHIRKEYISDPAVPKAPLLLIVGPSGSGKTSTVTHAVERVIFSNEILPEIDLRQKREELLADEPVWKTIEEIDPTLSMEIARRKKVKFYKWLSQIPLARTLLKKRIGKSLSELEEQGLMIDYSMVTPNDYQTALAGEPGNYFKKALGDPRKTSIRHVEEAHSAFGKANGGRESGIERQQRTLIDTSNIVLDEIINGNRDCLLIATTDQPERFDPAIYRRFVEKGKIINISDYWKNPDNLREVIRLELLRHDIRTGEPDKIKCHKNTVCISSEDLMTAVEKVYTIFDERTLKIIPSYVRKLIDSVIEIKGDFSPQHLADSLLVRQAFELVARNSYGDLFGKVVDLMDRHVKWEEYVGSVKDTFSEMANNCLYYGVSEEKGVVLNGPPGSGKTFLVRTWLSENYDIHDISASPGSLQDPVNPIDGAVDNLEKVYEIAKMIAPTVVFFDEGDALAPRRSPSGGSPSDKLTNRFLNLIDGEIPLNRVFTVLTTNRLDILDPALIRSKRLKVMEISGQLRKKDIADIIGQSLKEVPLAPGLDVEAILETSQGLCNTPADYAAFVEKARSLRSTEYEVLLRLRSLSGVSQEDMVNFVKFNFKTLIGILGAVKAPQKILAQVKGNPTGFLNHYDQIINLLAYINGVEEYPLMPSHLSSARQEISKSPVKKGKVQLDEFLEAELSQEPQVGFIIGVGANDVAGMLLPIATSLTYNIGPEKVIVTGAVSSSAPAAAELDMAVKMTQQSAQEALTMVKNYLQDLDTKVSMSRLLGDYLDHYTIHHQLLSASYTVGGPSAGYALALNTLSALLSIPVYNDFGITGAPWTKGVKKGEVGGSVIIGGHKKKAQKVLLHLRRMYMPLQNYKDLEMEFLENYWSQGKDILGVTHFGDLVPEVIYLGEEYEKMLLDLIDMRIEYKLNKYKGNKPSEDIKEEIPKKKEVLKNLVEKEILSRLAALRRYLRTPAHDPHISLEEIFRKRRNRIRNVIEPFVAYIQKQRGKPTKSIR
ncbi:MAG: AAA family ATPase [Deltaproteobacteria bacterium]|nr:MAG: AAA family ATPase [Deltaproteobacteria bacterium]